MPSGAIDDVDALMGGADAKETVANANDGSNAVGAAGTAGRSCSGRWSSLEIGPKTTRSPIHISALWMPPTRFTMSDESQIGRLMLRSSPVLLRTVIGTSSAQYQSMMDLLQLSRTCSDQAGMKMAETAV